MKNYVNIFKSATLTREKHLAVSLRRLGNLRLFVLMSLFWGLNSPLIAQNCVESRSGDTAEGFSINNAYCGGNNSYSGPEIGLVGLVPEGLYHIKLTNLNADLDLFLVKNSDPSDCVAWSTNAGTDDEEINIPNLAEGEYTLYIDGYDGATSSFTLLNCAILPDYTSISLNGPTSAHAGEEIQLNLEIQNIGNAAGDGGNGREAFWLADQPDFSGSFEEYLGASPTPSLEPSAFARQEPTLTIPADITPGTYYIIHVIDGDEVIEEKNERNNRNAHQIEIINPPPPTCENPINLAMGEPYNGNTANGLNNFEKYNNDNRFEHTGPEIVHKIDWTGGVMNILLKDRSADLDFMVLASCDPDDFITASNKAFTIAPTYEAYESILLDPGIYYIIVDGWQGAMGTYNLLVEKGDENQCEDSNNRMFDPFGNGQLDECDANISALEIAYLKQFEAEFQRFLRSPQVNNRTVMSFPITVHFGRKSDGSGGIEEGERKLGEAVANLNNLFQPANVSFFVCGIKEIKSDEFYNFQRYQQYQLLQQHYVANTINIYIPGTYGCVEEAIGGYAKFPAPGNPDIIVIGRESFTDNVLTHEMGHYFNLYHTHDTNFGEELVDGSNCQIAGDLLCDTPADPRLRRSGDNANVTENCVYTGNEVDSNGDAYSPLTNNIMCYSFPECLTMFTTQQYARIAWAAQNLRSYLTCDNPQLPDYTITAMSVDTDLIIPGVDFRVDYTIANEGNADGPASSAHFYLSTNSSLEQGDVLIKSVGTVALEAGETTSRFGSRVIPEGTSSGTYYLIIQIDPNNSVNESNENNNTLAIQITVGGDQKPDYQPTDFVARGGATTLQAGGTIVIDLKIRNNGPVDGQGNEGKDKYYFNTTPDLNGSPIFLRDFGTADIAANSHYDVNSGPLTIPENTTPGTYYIVFFHDADNKIDESNEDNNITFLEIAVTAPGSGLDVDFTADQSSICLGESVQFIAQVSTGDRLAYDQTGNGSNGQFLNFEGTPFVENDGYGKSLSFDGINDYVELPQNLTTNLDNFTFETWYFYEEKKTWQRIMDFGTGISTYMMLTPSGHTGTPQFEMRSPSERLISPDELTTGNWYHFAVVLDGSTKTAKLYIDGQLKGERAITNLPSDLGNLNQTWLGRSQWPDPYLKGQLDEVRIWSTARTQAEIQTNKDRELTGNEDGLLVYYDFNQQASNATYNWVFEGGTPATSNASNPSVTYPNTGTYPVSLTVSNGGQTDAEVKEGFIVVGECGNSLIADFTADKTEPCVGETVQFYSTSSSSGANLVYDFSKNGKHGNLKDFEDAPYVDNATYGKALNFDGENDYVELSSNLTEGLTDMTIEVRFKYEENRAWQRVFDLGKDGDHYIYFSPTNNNGEVAFGVVDRSNNVTQGIRWFTLLEPDQWHHFAFVWDGTANKIYSYRNGTKVNYEIPVEGTSPSAVAGQGQNAFLGKSKFNQPYLKGKIDEFRIWSTARSESEIQANKDKILTGNEDGLVTYYSFETPPVIEDRSVKGNDGVLKGLNPSFVDHEGFGKALSFDGADNYAELPKALTIDIENFTLETWFYTGTIRAWDRVFDFGTSTSNFISFTPHSGWTGNPQFHNRFDGEYQLVDYPEAIAPNTWYHFAIVWDENGLVKLYLNGELKAEKTINKKPADIGNFTNNFLGKSQYPSDRLLGELDEFRLWNTARTQAQIQANKDKELLGNEAGLLVYYNFDQNITGNLTYNWSFPGGTPSSSTDVNPTVTYATTGNYNVSLTVSNSSKSDTETKNNYITVQGCEPDWSVTETADYHLVLVPSNADITLLGQSITAGDYIGAFYNDNGTLKCAGKAQWTGENLSITVFGDDATTNNTKEGFETGENFQWKLWKASNNQELYAATTYEAPAGIVTHTGEFAVNGVSKISSMTGTTQPQTATQTISLQPGWNYISSYIKASQSDMPSIFSAIQSDVVIVKNGNGEVYMPNPAVNSIGNWNVIDGYQVKVSGNSPVELTFTGQKVDLATTTIPFSTGHNLFAYLRESEQPVHIAMAPIANEVDVITDVRGRAYIPDLGINNIGNMKPGQGYWAKMKSAVNLNYNARLATPPANMHTAQITPKQYKIARRGSYHATMILDTKGLAAFGDEVGVFDMEGKLVGAASYEDHILTFPIWGDDPTTDLIDGLEEGAMFEIRVWNKATATETTFDFSANVDLYTIHGIIEAELLRTMSTASALNANSLTLYPNPTRDDATLSLTLKAHTTVKASLFDLAGKHLFNITEEEMTAGSHQLKISTTQLPSGLYHCRILIDGVIYNIPFSVVK